MFEPGDELGDDAGILQRIVARETTDAVDDVEESAFASDNVFSSDSGHFPYSSLTTQRGLSKGVTGEF